MVRAGPYELLEQIGRGGMGTVWRARHAELGVIRAVKLLERTTPERAARFQREVALLARVRHPNVVAIHEAGLADERPFFAMELVEGEPLDRVLERGALPWRRGVEVLAAIARGVGALHAAGIVHRDLKPQNVVLDREGRPVVLDLGVALAPEQDARLTRPGGLVGTIAYLPPEALRGEQTGARGDVFALGVILFELLRGAPALELRPEPQAALAQVALRGALRPGLADPALPARLDAACARATDPSPARRHADAGALADELEALLREPGPACGAGRRHGRVALAGLGLLGAGGLLLLLRPGPEPAGPVPAAASAPVPAPAAPRSQAAPAPDPAALEAGERELRRALRLPEPARRLKSLGEWLAAHPGHPRTDEARVARRQDRLQVPVRAWALGQDGLATWDEGPGPARGWLAVDKALWLLDPGSAEPLRRWDLPTHSTALVAAPRGGVWVAGAGRDLEDEPYLVRVEAGQNGLLDRRTLGGFPRALLALEDGMVCGLDQAVLVLRPGQAPARLDVPGAVRALAASPDGRLLAAGHGEGAGGTVPYSGAGVTVWRWPGLELACAVTFPDRVNGLAFGPDGRLFAGTSARRLVELDLARGEPGPELVADEVRPDLVFLGPRRAHDWGVVALAVQADPPTLWSAGGDTAAHAGEVRGWDLARGRAPGRILHLGEKALSLRPTADGRWLLVGTEVSGAFLFALEANLDPAGELLEPAPSARR